MAEHLRIENEALRKELIELLILTKQAYGLIEYFDTMLEENDDKDYAYQLLTELWKKIDKLNYLIDETQN